MTREPCSAGILPAIVILASRAQNRRQDGGATHTVAAARFSIFNFPFSTFKMPLRCAGYDPPQKSFPNIWSPCPRNALRGDRFCRRHRTALDGAILGLLQTEFHDARALTESADNNSAEPRDGLAVTGGKTVACLACGTLWEEDSLIRQRQLLACEAEYVFQPPFFDGNAPEPRASVEPASESAERTGAAARSESAKPSTHEP